MACHAPREPPIFPRSAPADFGRALLFGSFGSTVQTLHPARSSAGVLSSGMPKVIPESVWKSVDRWLRAGHSDRAVSDMLAAKGIKVSVPTVGKRRREQGIEAEPLPSRRIAPTEHKPHKKHAGTKFSELRADVVRLRESTDPPMPWRKVAEQLGCSPENARQLYLSR